MKVEKKLSAKDYVEKIGVSFEKEGFQPAMGRIFAYLIIADPPHKSFEEILEYLKISKSAVSTSLNYLMSRDLVEYITLPGDRKRYFKINMSGWLTLIKKKMARRSFFGEIMKEALSARSNKYKEFNDALEEQAEFLDFMHKEMKDALDKWERKKKKKG